MQEMKARCAGTESELEGVKAQMSKLATLVEREVNVEASRKQEQTVAEMQETIQALRSQCSQQASALAAVQATAAKLQGATAGVSDQIAACLLYTSPSPRD